VGKWDHRDEGKRISQSVLQGKTTEDLRNSQKFIKGLLDLRKSQKLTKTYIEGTKKAIKYNGVPKVFVDYRFDGTATGRLSCAAYSAKEAMGVSFHTLPRDTDNNIRSLFNCPEDYRFVTVDYAAMELRVLSHIAKDGNMQTAFTQGADLHTYTAQMLFNKPEISKEERQIAKAISFLIAYGGGAFNLAETTGISVGRAKKIIGNYQNVYPAIFEYMEFVEKFIKENHYAYTIFGRRRNLPDITSKDFKVVNRAARQGLNFTIQSTASDILLCGLLGTHRRLKEEGIDAKPVATVHDSIELICHKDATERCLEIVYDELVNYPFIKEHFNIHFDVPFKIDAEVGFSFGDGVEVDFQDGKPQNLQEIQEYMND
jgi:DNA polymerase-1